MPKPDNNKSITSRVAFAAHAAVAAWNNEPKQSRRYFIPRGFVETPPELPETFVEAQKLRMQLAGGGAYQNIGDMSPAWKKFSRDLSRVVHETQQGSPVIDASWTEHAAGYSSAISSGERMRRAAVEMFDFADARNLWEHMSVIPMNCSLPILSFLNSSEIRPIVNALRKDLAAYERRRLTEWAWISRRTRHQEHVHALRGNLNPDQIEAIRKEAEIWTSPHFDQIAQQKARSLSNEWLELNEQSKNVLTLCVAHLEEQKREAVADETAFFDAYGLPRSATAVSRMFDEEISKLRERVERVPIGGVATRSTATPSCDQTELSALGLEVLCAEDCEVALENLSAKLGAHPKA